MAELPASYYVTAFGIGLLLTFGLFVAVMIGIRRTSLRLVCVGVGVLTFTASQLVTRLPIVSVSELWAWEWIASHPWLWMIILSVSAGLFEETARALGFRFLLYRQPDRMATPVGLGIGHGGLEAMALVGVGQLVTAVTFLLIQFGVIQLPAETLSPLSAQRSALLELGPVGQLAALYERATAMVLHIALSMLVFRAVRDRAWFMIIIAIGFHAAVNFAALTSVRWFGSDTALAIWQTELVITVSVAVVVMIVWLIWRTGSSRRPLTRDTNRRRSGE